MTHDPKAHEGVFNWPEDIHTTAGYEQHQQEVIDWLTQVSSANLGIFIKGPIDTLQTFSGRYGFVPALVEDNREKLTQLAREDQERFRVVLQKSHISMVIGSPVLGVFQKGDLLTLSAQALYNGQIPVNAGLVVKGAVKHIHRTFKRILASGPNAVSEQLDAHYASLMKVVEEGVPMMSRTQFLKHLASKETGQEVANPLVAFGVALAVTERPSPKQQRKIDKRQEDMKQRRIARLYRKNNRDLQRFARSGERLSEARREDTDAIDLRHRK